MNTEQQEWKREHKSDAFTGEGGRDRFEAKVKTANFEILSAVSGLAAEIAKFADDGLAKLEAGEFDYIEFIKKFNEMACQLHALSIVRFSNDKTIQGLGWALRNLVEKTWDSRTNKYHSQMGRAYTPEPTFKPETNPFAGDDDDIGF